MVGRTQPAGDIGAERINRTDARAVCADRLDRSTAGAITDHRNRTGAH
jgi:hypothetical protein